MTLPGFREIVYTHTMSKPHRKADPADPNRERRQEGQWSPHSNYEDFDTRARFNNHELYYTAELGYWPEGIQFIHRRTGQIITLKEGVFYCSDGVPAKLISFQKSKGETT